MHVIQKVVQTTMELGAVRSVFEKRIIATYFTLWELEELGHSKDKTWRFK